MIGNRYYVPGIFPEFRSLRQQITAPVNGYVSRLLFHTIGGGVTPERNTLLVDGIVTPITAGMSVSTEVKVGKRRIIEFFIYPLIKYLDEGVSVM